MTKYFFETTFQWGFSSSSSIQNSFNRNGQKDRSEIPLCRDSEKSKKELTSLNYPKSLRSKPFFAVPFSKGQSNVGSTRLKESAIELTRGFAATTNSSTSIEYKNLSYLRRFITDQGKILSRRVTGLNAKQQREITKAVKQARILGLLGFTTTSKGDSPIESALSSRVSLAKSSEG